LHERLRSERVPDGSVRMRRLPPDAGQALMASAVTDRAISAIKQMVVDGTLKPGDRLPTEAELSERIGVSRNSLREAVKALSVIRVLDVRQGDGTYVTALEPEQLLESLAFVLDLHQDSSYVEIIEIRRLLEPVAVEQACPHLTDEDFTRLEQTMAELDDSSTIEELVAADIAFHHLINARCPNDYLSTLLDSLASSTARARVWRGLTDDSAVERTLSEHRRILDALRAGRPDLARTYAAAHIAGVESWLLHQGEPPTEHPTPRALARPRTAAPTSGPRPAASNEDRQIPCQIRPETARNLPIPGRTGQGWRGRVAVRALAHAPARGRPTGIRERLTKLRIRKDASPCEHARERGARKRGSSRARKRERRNARAWEDRAPHRPAGLLRPRAPRRAAGTPERRSRG